MKSQNNQNSYCLQSTICSRNHGNNISSNFMQISMVQLLHLIYNYSHFNIQSSFQANKVRYFTMFGPLFISISDFQ